MNLNNLLDNDRCLKGSQWPLLVTVALSLLLAPATYAAERDSYESNGLTFSISVRTPDQIRAFYSARGFPEDALIALDSKCLLTVGIRNNRKDVAWLEPSKWKFITAQGVDVPRVSRDEWAQRWEALNIPLASRATFGWTQLPESRDLYPGETAGGNIAVIPPASAFTVTALFETGMDKSGTPIKFQSAPLTCGNSSGAQK